MNNAALPAEWVARIFARLSIRYGKAFAARWDGIDEQLVRDDWAEQLAGMKARPDCIAYALANLPAEWPPTVGQFRELCNSMPEPEFVALPQPKADIPRVRAELERLRKPTTEVPAQGPKGWAYRLRDRESAGDKLGVCQRMFWRSALQGDTSGPEIITDQALTEELKRESSRKVAAYTGAGQ